MAKIAELQSRLAEVRIERKTEEDAEILKSFRSMELETWDLYNLATGIKDGEISMEMLRQVMAVGAASKTADADEESAFAEQGSGGVPPAPEEGAVPEERTGGKNGDVPDKGTADVERNSPVGNDTGRIAGENMDTGSMPGEEVENG